MPQHFLSLLDWPAPELQAMLEQAIFVKNEFKSGISRQTLQGQTLTMLFQRPSLRTRLSFELAMQQLGGQAIYIGAGEVELGKRESVADVVRTLARYTQCILARVSDHALLLEMAKWSAVPVINGLSKYSHPCQAMADVLTIHEACNRVKDVRVTFLGDSLNDVTRSLMFAAAQFGFQLTLSSPAGHWMDGESIAKARACGGDECVRLVDDPLEAVRDCQVIYTDTWTWAGLMPAEIEERLRSLKPYQVNQALLAHAPASTIVLHCMPANRGQEISDDAADGPQSRLFDQAENRLHAQKAILLHLLS